MARRIISIDVGIKNLAYCVLERRHASLAADSALRFTMTRWEAFRVGDAGDKGSSDRTSLALVRALDDKDLLDAADAVVVEKQPRSNVQMRVVEGILCTYFACKGVTSSESAIERVVSYSPKRKLGSAGAEMRGASRYADRKKTGIKLCSSFLRSEQGLDSVSEELREMFFASSKKDDLADCFLQGMEYMDRGSVDTIVPDARSEEDFHRVTARKPTALQERRGYSLSNVKWIVTRATSADSLRAAYETNLRLRAAVARYFSSDLERAVRRFSGNRP